MSPSCDSSRSRARGARCRRRLSNGRPCRLSAVQSSIAQPSREAARLKAPGCGTIVISSIGKWRASKVPTPYHSGSPLASTVTRLPRRAAISPSVSASGWRQISRSAAKAPWRHHREMPGAADQHFRGFDQGARRRGDVAQPALADPDDAEPAVHDGIRAAHSALTAAAASALPPRRPRNAINGNPRPNPISASFASAAPTNPTGNPSTRAGGRLRRR